MSVTNPRTRVVYFRVSADEFQLCVKACEAGGARSVSDLARTAVMNAIDRKQTDNGAAPEIVTRLQMLEQTIREMNDRLNALFGTLESRLTNPALKRELPR